MRESVSTRILENHGRALLLLQFLQLRAAACSHEPNDFFLVHGNELFSCLLLLPRVSASSTFLRPQSIAREDGIQLGSPSSIHRDEADSMSEACFEIFSTLNATSIHWDGLYYAPNFRCLPLESHHYR